MYIPLLIAKEIEDKLNVSVKYHATTRSPITISKDKDYKINNGFKFKSLNDNERINHIYNIDEYDEILVITDNNHWFENDYEDTETIFDVISNYSNNFVKFIMIR